MSYLYPDIDEYRTMTKGNYATDFSNLNDGYMFPPTEVRSRNKVYKHNMRLFTGEYAKNKQLVAQIDGIYQPINYKVLPLNYFELIVNKLDSLLFGNELTVKTGNIERDKVVNELIDKTAWVKSVRQAVKLCEIYGDSCLKTYKYGASAFSPLFAYKVVDESDKNNVKGYVLHEIIYDKEHGPYENNYTPAYIRILISCAGYDFERVYRYFGTNAYGRLGEPVKFKYKNRWIPKSGKYYWSGIDKPTVQWLSVNTEKDGVYGTSSFQSIKQLVFAIENRLSTENWVIDAHGKPYLVVGMQSLKTDERTGNYYLSVINGKYMVNNGNEVDPHYVEWDGKLDASKTVRDDLMSSFYELSEMGKTFLSGEYTGNVSEESLNNIIKSAIDRGNREVNDFWYSIRDSLYVLCKLNNIDIDIEDINIQFNVGRTDDDKQVAEIAGLLTSQGILSKETTLSRYFGYNEEQARAELVRIKNENAGGVGENDGKGKVETVIRE